jgi:hypothetical protein
MVGVRNLHKYVRTYVCVCVCVCAELCVWIYIWNKACEIFLEKCREHTYTFCMKHLIRFDNFKHDIGWKLQDIVEI